MTVFMTVVVAVRMTWLLYAVGNVTFLLACILRAKEARVFKRVRLHYIVCYLEFLVPLFQIQ